MRVFRLVAESGSFVRAARQLGLSPAMASKHVAHLEKQLGARLLNRTSRHVSPTEAGTVYFEQCCEALDVLDNAESALQSSGEEPRGLLKVTAPVWCANARFAAMLASYRERYPQVVLDLRLTNHKVDLAEEGFDLALRATSQNLPSLIVRPLCPVPFVLVAATTWLARQPPIDTPADLARHAAILPSYIKAPNEITLTGAGGKTVVKMTAAMKSDDSTLAYQSILAGIGPGYLPEWLVADGLASGRLQRILPRYELPAITLYAAYTSRKFLAPKVRTFIDFFSDAFGRQGGG
jgi:DNA-binding transcriptional LysR family regulator